MSTINDNIQTKAIIFTIWIIFILSANFLLQCHPPSSSAHQKMDAILRKQMQAETPVILSMTGRCSTEIDQTIKLELEETGINIQTIIGTIFTAKGNRNAILKLVKKKTIIRLEAARKYYKK